MEENTRQIDDCGKRLLKQLTAIKVIQKFAHQKYNKRRINYNESHDNSARKQLIKKFILNFERTQREPIVNISQEERNKYFQDYCATIIQNAARAYRRRLLIQLKTYEIYKIAAKTIFTKFIRSQLHDNYNFRLAKVLRIQKLLRGYLCKQKFQKIKTKIKQLSDPNITSPIQLLKLLDQKNADLIQSFGQDFVIRFRLCQEDDINGAAKPPQILGSIGASTGEEKKPFYQPKIYYKIFLRQKVVDVAETAPRNYAIELKTGVEDRRLWYVRFTNQPWKQLNGKVLTDGQYIGRPVLTKPEVSYLKNYKQMKWRQKLTRKWILEGIGIDEEEELDDDLNNFIKNIDYYRYENEWRDFGTNTFSQQFAQEQMKRIQEDMANEAEKSPTLYTSLE